MKGRSFIIGLIVCISFFLVSCDKLKFSKKPASESKKEPFTSKLPVTGTVIAKVNGYPITLEDLEEEIDRYNNAVPEDKPELKITTREKKLDYLKNEVIKRILLYQEALDRGLDRNPEVIKALENTKQQLLVYQLVKEETDKVNVTPQEIKDYYNVAKENLKEPEERKIREIVVISESQAKDLLIRLLQGEDFASLARQYSKAPTAEKGGDLGFIKPGTKFKEFDEIAFSDALSVGGISSVFKGPDGYYIITVEGKKGGKQKTLSEMWDDIKRGLTFIKQQKRIDDLVGNLSRNAKIEIMEDKIQ